MKEKKKQVKCGDMLPEFPNLLNNVWVAFSGSIFHSLHAGDIFPVFTQIYRTCKIQSITLNTKLQFNTWDVRRLSEL